MPEYVYALFEFVPENPDEIYLKAGDRIEVLEKDDVYSDGWWQVSPLESTKSSRPASGQSPGLRPRRTRVHGEKACCECLERGSCVLFHHRPTSVTQHVSAGTTLPCLLI